MAKKVLSEVLSKSLMERIQMMYVLFSRLENEVQKNLTDFVDKQKFIPPDRRKQIKHAISRLRSRDIAERARKTRVEIEKRIGAGIERSLASLNIATKRELKALGKKLDSLSAQIQSTKGKV